MRVKVLAMADQRFILRALRNSNALPISYFGKDIKAVSVCKRVLVLTEDTALPDARPIATIQMIPCCFIAFLVV
jgi:hypothetical protein